MASGASTGHNPGMARKPISAHSTAAARRRVALATTLLLSATLGACDMLGIDTPAKQEQRREAEGRAIGAACRHTQRSLEDCYAANPKASKAAIFAGWREMDEYMRENNIPSAPAPAPPPPAAAHADTGVAPGEEVIEAPKAAAPTGDKAGAGGKANK